MYVIGLPPTTGLFSMSDKRDFFNSNKPRTKGLAAKKVSTLTFLSTLKQRNVVGGIGFIVVDVHLYNRLGFPVKGTRTSWGS